MGFLQAVITPGHWRPQQPRRRHDAQEAPAGAAAAMADEGRRWQDGVPAGWRQARGTAPSIADALPHGSLPYSPALRRGGRGEPTAGWHELELGGRRPVGGHSCGGPARGGRPTEASSHAAAWPRQRASRWPGQRRLPASPPPLALLCRSSSVARGVGWRGGGGGSARLLAAEALCNIPKIHKINHALSYFSKLFSLSSRSS